MSDRQEREFIKLLREHGMRQTQARLAVMGALHVALVAKTHRQIAEGMVDRSIDPATVYRNLIDLHKAGIILRIGERGSWRYEWLQKKGQRHPHFVCKECGEVSCLLGVRLRVGKAPRSFSHLLAQRMEIQLRGICEKCE